MKISIKLDAGALMPTRAHETDAGYDLYALDDAYIRSGSSAVINTGVHMQIPAGMYGLVAGRSGLNFNAGIICPQGTIDSGYTGAIKVKLYNVSGDTLILRKGDRIAQIIFQLHESPEFECVPYLDDTERGNGGFGSSGM